MELKVQLELMQLEERQALILVQAVVVVVMGQVMVELVAQEL